MKVGPKSMNNKPKTFNKNKFINIKEKNMFLLKESGYLQLPEKPDFTKSTVFQFVQTRHRKCNL